MWFKVFMIAEEVDEAVVQLSCSEYESVKKFLNQIKEQRCRLSWVGGHWSISDPCNTEEEAERLINNGFTNEEH